MKERHSNERARAYLARQDSKRKQEQLALMEPILAPTFRERLFAIFRQPLPKSK